MSAIAERPPVAAEPVDPRLDRIAEAATTSYREWLVHRVAIFLGDHPELAGPNEPEDFGDKAWDLIHAYTEAQSYSVARVITMIAGMRNPSQFFEGYLVDFACADLPRFMHQVGEEILYRDLCIEVRGRWTVAQSRPWRDEAGAAQAASS